MRTISPVVGPKSSPLPLENAQYLYQLNAANPSGADRLQQGDDHIRLIKAALKATFPNITGPVNASTDWLNNVIPAALVPFGAITLFYGENAPSGWAICDGRTVAKSDGSGSITVPDLRGRVPVGASSSQPAGTMFGQWTRKVTSEVSGGHRHDVAMGSAGQHGHGSQTGSTALTVAQMPPHNHGNGIADDETTAFPYGTKPALAGVNLNLDRGYSSGQGITETIGAGEGHTHAISDDGAHTHSVSLSEVGGHTHEVSIDVAQPSLAVTYIMKI